MLLRCSVSGGLEDFCEEQVRRLLVRHDDDSGSRSCVWKLHWHHRGYSGSLLDVEVGPSEDDPRCPALDLAQETFLTTMVSQLLFVEYVALQVGSEEILTTDDTDDETLLDAITEGCARLPPGRLARAVRVWTLWQPHVKAALPLHPVEGELLVFPTTDTATTTVQVPTDTITRAFRVNSIFTQPHVAKGVVQTFVQLVYKELHHCRDNSDEILWLDAGAGAGSLLNELPSHTSLGVDLEPQQAGVYEKNFFDVTNDWLRQDLGRSFGHLCVICNPPFSEGNRGDYNIIAKFLQHAIDLRARFMGVLCPAKFVRVWRSFGLASSMRLTYRMLLPANSFFDPSTNQSKHLECHFLVFDLQPPMASSFKDGDGCNPSAPEEEDTAPGRMHVVAQRDKGLLPQICTAQVTAAVVRGLAHAGVPLGSSHTSTMVLRAKVGRRWELFLELNPQRPLSVVNAMSARIEHHSLGWMATSARPPVAGAMHSLSQGGPPQPQLNETNDSWKTPTVVVNLMCGEGTLDFEALQHTEERFGFRIVGDHNAKSLHRVASQVKTLRQVPLVDFVVWDAQNLPFRDGVIDSLFCDLPFAGSTHQAHQIPSSGITRSGTLSYPQLLAECVRVLRSETGTAVLVSPDTKVLGHATRRYAGNLKESWQTKVNLGGLTGRLCLLERKAACWKDLNLLVNDSATDHSTEILAIARQACSQFSLDRLLGLQRARPENTNNLVMDVVRQNEYSHADGSIRHCYRLCFHAHVSNVQAKTLEQAVRLHLRDNPIRGTKL
jgi:predicted RNA methylase